MYTYTDSDKEKIKLNPLNKQNCRALPDLVRYAESYVRWAEMQPCITPKQMKERNARLADARALLDDRRNKLNLYKDCFPDLFDGNNIKKPALI